MDRRDVFYMGTAASDGCVRKVIHKSAGGKTLTRFLVEHFRAGQKRGRPTPNFRWKTIGGDVSRENAAPQGCSGKKRQLAESKKQNLAGCEIHFRHTLVLGLGEVGNNFR